MRTWPPPHKGSQAGIPAPNCGPLSYTYATTMQTDQISKTHYKVSDFIAWAKTSTLILSPSFQRRSVWPAGAKSYLIDTIMRGFPIPIIFLRERKTNLDTLEAKREVVDGQQRIRAILTFIQPSLLKGFDPAKDAFTIKKAHNKDLADLPFNDPPRNGAAEHPRLSVQRSYTAIERGRS